MLESGLTEDKYAATQSNFKDIVHLRYDDQDYTKDWRKWRAESRLWDFYFSPQYFPGREPRIRPPPISTSHFSLNEETNPKQYSVANLNPIQEGENQGSTLLSKTDSISRSSRVCSGTFKDERKADDYYRLSINQRADTHWCSMNERRNSRKRSANGITRQVANLHPSHNSRTQDNLASRSVQKYEECIASWNDLSSPGALVMEKNYANSNTSTLHSPETLAASQSSFPSSVCLPSTVRKTYIIQSSSPPGYRPLEKIMETKAIALGIRQPFFQVLQKMRDLANAQHTGCTKQYRNWLADSLTWGILFKGPFPGKEPEGPDMHSVLCISSGMEAAALSDTASELCWKVYARHHSSSDVDRLLIEEQVKSEGGLRMVLDVHTGEVVNLDVFAARTRLRALQPIPSNLASGHGASTEYFKDSVHYAGRQKRKDTGAEESSVTQNTLCGFKKKA